MTTRFVGIDPGSQVLGVGCIEKRGSQIILIKAEAIQAPKSKPLYERLEIIKQRLTDLLDELSPHEVAIEDIFNAKNSRSAFHLGLARGVALSACFGRNIRIYEYPPNQVKSVVTGYGRADKEQVKKMVQLIVGHTVNVGYDASDAVAIAICHASIANFARKTTC